MIAQMRPFKKLHKHKIMVLGLLCLLLGRFAVSSVNSRLNLATEGSPGAFCVLCIMEKLSIKTILLMTFPLSKKLPPFTLTVLLSFHILINDSQKLSVHVENKKQNP